MLVGAETRSFALGKGVGRVLGTQCSAFEGVWQWKKGRQGNQPELLVVSCLVRDRTKANGMKLMLGDPCLQAFQTSKFHPDIGQDLACLVHSEAFPPCRWRINACDGTWLSGHLSPCCWRLGWQLDCRPRLSKALLMDYVLQLHNYVLATCKACCPCTLRPSRVPRKACARRSKPMSGAAPRACWAALGGRRRRGEERRALAR